MNSEDFAVLCEVKARLAAAEERYPDSRALRKLHNQATRALFRLRNALSLTDEQFNELASPQGGGTPKTPPPEED